jgi:CubicO group peptidase (beta-lactamase class C family)
MRWRSPTHAVLLALVAWLGVLAAPGDGSLPRAHARPDVEPDGILEAIRARHDVPGLAGAVVTRTGIVEVAVAGVRCAGDEAKVTPEDAWHVGSCTKAMTAVLVARLVDAGRLRWDTTLGEALPALGETMHADWRDVPLRLLLANRAGAPASLERDGLWGALWRHEGTPVEARALLARGVLAHSPVHAPGTRYLYANAGFALAGHALETLLGEPYESLLRAEVFEPLGMEGAGFGAPGEGQPRGHRVEEGRLVPVPPGPGADNPPAITPAGRVHLPLAAWARFVQVFLAPDDEEKPFLRPVTRRALVTPPEGQTYALGWDTAERGWGGGRVLTHAGSNTMWYAVAWVAPLRDVAVLVVCNVAGERGPAACDEAAGALLRWHAGR